MESGADTGARPVAIEAHGVRKGYRLGELSSLQHTVRHLIGRPDQHARPQLEALAGVEFTVFRGSEYIATIVIDKVFPNYASGRTKAGLKKREVQAGDEAATNL